MSFQILQRAYAPYGTAAQFPASGDSRLIYRATDTGYLYTWDASESAYKLAGIDPATAPYLGLHAQADDAARLGGQLPSYYAANGHTHAQSAIDSSSGWITTALAGKQAAGSYLTTTGTAADSSKLGGVAASGYIQSGGHAVVRSIIVENTDKLIGVGITPNFTQVTQGVNTTIATNPPGHGAVGGLYFVIGDNGVDGFCDEVIFVFSSAPTVLHSITAYGSPPARTYSNS